MKKAHYFIRDKENKPIITVALIQEENNIGMGVSICSKLDQPSKACGRSIAYERAMYALKKRKDSGIVGRDKSLNIIENNCKKSQDFQFKSYFNPALTSFERRLLDNIKEK